MATEQFTTLGAATLFANITNVATSFDVTNDATYPFPTVPQFRARIGNEIVLVTAVTLVSGSRYTWTVTRGIEGTTGAAGSTGDAVTAIVTAAAIAQMKNDLLSKFYVSPAEIGYARAFTTAGNFTVGLRFRFLRACTWTGVRLGVSYASTKLWKVRAYNLTDSAALTNTTSSAVSQGVIDVLFGTPQSITNIAKDYLASAYETTGGIFAGSATFPVELNTSTLWSPNVWAVDNSMFVAGDGAPTTSGSSTRMSVEPIYTIP